MTRKNRPRNPEGTEETHPDWTETRADGGTGRLLMLQRPLADGSHLVVAPAEPQGWGWARMRDGRVLADGRRDGPKGAMRAADRSLRHVPRVSATTLAGTLPATDPEGATR